VDRFETTNIIFKIDDCGIRNIDQERRKIPLMKPEKLYAMAFASVYPYYIRKAEAKGRTREELDEIIRWLTGYTKAVLTMPRSGTPKAALITGVVCGIRVESIQDPSCKRTDTSKNLLTNLPKARLWKRS